MQPTTQGAFCLSCQKEVVDFTKMDDTAVQNFLLNNAGKKICGRATSSQLGQFNLVINEQIFNRNIASWKKYLAVLLICFGGLISCTNNTEIGRTMRKMKVDTTNTVDNDYTVGDMIRIDSLIPPPPPSPPPTPKGLILIPAKQNAEVITITETVTQGGMDVPPMEEIKIQETFIECYPSYKVPLKDTIPKKVKDTCDKVIFS